MRTYNRDELNRRLQEAETADILWNVQFQSLRSYASSLFDRESRGLRDEILEVMGGPRHSQTEPLLTQLYDGVPYEIRGTHKFGRFVGKFSGTSDRNEIVRVYAGAVAFVSYWTLVDDVLTRLRPTVRKGRQLHPTQTPARTLDHTGTCAYCGHNVKMDKSGRLVAHGYNRPGIGYVVGGCLCQHQKPIEVSPDGLVYVVKALTAMETSRLESLRQWETDPVRPVRQYLSRTRSFVEITPSDPTYMRERNNVMANLRSEIGLIQADRQQCEQRLARWEPRSLPNHAA